MINLTINPNLSATPTQIQDQQSKLSGLYLTDQGTGTTHVSANGKFVLGLDANNGGGNGEWIQNSVSAQSPPLQFGISFFGAGQERMRLDNTGNLTVGGRLTCPQLGTFLGAGHELLINLEGRIFINSSSERFMENITELKDDFDSILSLTPVSFQSKETGETGFGYTAESLHEQGLENLVSYDAEGNPSSVRYNLMAVYLLEVLKEQRKMMKDLYAEVDALKPQLKEKYV